MQAYRSLTVFHLANFGQWIKNAVMYVVVSVQVGEKNVIFCHQLQRHYYSLHCGKMSAAMRKNGLSV